MRKKSLRAMTSSVFETPESRAEAILQNILGANNVLVPPEAPFEEILQAILYNTPYTKEAETRIEKILLAIKNNGTYDEEAQSRDEEILISKLNETAYTKDAESRIEELLILWAAQSVIKQLEGVPPLAFTAQGQPLINWIINGANGGVGDKTANWFDITNATFACGYGSNLISPDNFVDFSVNGNSITINVKETSHSAYVMIGFCENGGTYTVKTSTTPAKDWGVYATSSIQLPITFSDSSKFTALVARNQDASKTFTVPQGFNYIWISTGAGSKYTVTISNIMLNTGSTALPFEPPGYKIPILCGGETNTIYLDTPLYDGDSISMADTGIEIPTINGQNTLAFDTTVQPEKVYIEYK